METLSKQIIHVLPHKRAHYPYICFLSSFQLSIYNRIISLIVLAWYGTLNSQVYLSLLLYISYWGGVLGQWLFLTVDPVSKSLRTFDENRHKRSFKKSDKNNCLLFKLQAISYDELFEKLKYIGVLYLLDIWYIIVYFINMILTSILCGRNYIVFLLYKWGNKYSDQYQLLNGKLWL